MVSVKNYYAVRDLVELVKKLESGEVELLGLQIDQEIIELAPLENSDRYGSGRHQTWTIVTKKHG